MKKLYKVEIEIELGDLDEQSAISLARDHYQQVGWACEPLDEQSVACRSIPPEEFVPDPIGAIMELITANALLEKAGIDVVGVSCQENPAIERNRYSDV